MKKFKNVTPQVNFPLLEEKWEKYWKENKTFEKSVRGDKNYTFYDGPPFATGLPHYGHLLAGVMKDVVPRFYTMKGYKVERRFGWDCHGLPVEAEVQKKLGLYSRKDVLNYGVDKFNEECRSLVLRYTDEWKKTVSRVGRWVDMENPYHTMDVAFMESVWWVFQQLFNKGMVYEDYKVVPYSPSLGSVLSNFEANQNYKEVEDLALTVKFKTSEGFFLLAWTTTPWTLPMNSGLAVNSSLEYAKVKYKDEELVLLLEKVSTLCPEAEVLETFRGDKLDGLKYESLFSNDQYPVVLEDFVTAETGTGVVHLAPAFGEEDFKAGKRNGLKLLAPMDDDGVFTSEAGEFSGLVALDSVKTVAKNLRDRKLVFKQENYKHQYPHCYRTQNKLMYRAVSSWFVKVENMRDNLLKNNQTTKWNPDHLRDGRFGNWLGQARDWAVSRNRFWGTPLPLWKNQEGEVLCVGSKAELEKLTGTKLEDLHSHFLSHLEVPSPTGKSNLKWTGGVLDCWFESGAMPYAQHGYPHKEGSFEKMKNFPADFVSEGLDQTRGWFYTLMVLGTALFDKAPYKNVLVNGLVLAEDGKKMSKMLKNYPDPMELLNSTGADALRLYLLNSPVVAAEELWFEKEGVTDQVRKNLLRLHNVLSFLTTYAEVDSYVPQESFNSTNVLDKWLVSRYYKLVREVTEEMESYHLDKVVPNLSSFVEDLTNTYVRFNRNLFWQPGLSEEKKMAYDTLYSVLKNFAKVLAPFAPFYAEELFSSLGEETSVHLEYFPESNSEKEDLGLEKTVEVMLSLVELGRNYREQNKVKTKVPLRELTVVQKDPEVLSNLQLLEAFFLSELNVRKVTYKNNEENFVTLKVKPNFKTLGKKLGKEVSDFKEYLLNLSEDTLDKLKNSGSLEWRGHFLNKEDLLLERMKKTEDSFVVFNYHVVLVFDPYVGQDQVMEGNVREVLRKVQEQRKKLGLKLLDKVVVEVAGQNELLVEVLNQKDLFKEEALAKVQETMDLTNLEELKELEFWVGVKRL